jgi:hypothetical protein
MQSAHLHRICVRSLMAAAALACCAAVPAGPVPAAAAAASPGLKGVSARQAQDARFREAMRLHRAGHWSAAYGRFVALADEGHVPAARVALAMLQNGPRAYGRQWSAAPSQVAAWKHAVDASDATRTAGIP